MQGRPGKAAMSAIYRARLLGSPGDVTSLGFLRQGFHSEKLPGSFLARSGSSSRAVSSPSTVCSAGPPATSEGAGGSSSSSTRRSATSGLPTGSSPASMHRGPAPFRAASSMIAPSRVVRAAALDTTYDNYQQGGGGGYQQAGQLYVGHTIYKGKAALSLEPKRPEFQALPNGGYKLAREGVVFLKFAPGVGTRQYDWQSAKLFALSVLEMGRLVELERGQGMELFHDPYMNDPRAKGKVAKVFKVDPIAEGGFFFSFSMRDDLNGGPPERISLPISPGEFAVIRAALKFFIPYGMGWGAFCDPSVMLPSMIGEEGAPRGMGGGGDRDNWQ